MILHDLRYTWGCDLRGGRHHFTWDPCSTWGGQDGTARIMKISLPKTNSSHLGMIRGIRFFHEVSSNNVQYWYLKLFPFWLNLGRSMMTGMIFSSFSFGLLENLAQQPWHPKDCRSGWLESIHFSCNFDGLMVMKRKPPFAFGLLFFKHGT